MMSTWIYCLWGLLKDSICVTTYVFFEEHPNSLLSCKPRVPGLGTGMSNVMLSSTFWSKVPSGVAKQEKQQPKYKSRHPTYMSRQTKIHILGCIKPYIYSIYSHIWWHILFFRENLKSRWSCKPRLGRLWQRYVKCDHGTVYGSYSWDRFKRAASSWN